MLYVLLAIICLFSSYAIGMDTQDMQKISTYQEAKPFVNTLVAYSTSIKSLNEGAYAINADSSIKYGYVHKFLSHGTYGSGNNSAYKLICLSKHDAKPVSYAMTTRAMTENSLYMRNVTSDEAAAMRRAIQEKQAKFAGQC